MTLPEDLDVQTWNVEQWVTTFNDLFGEKDSDRTPVGIWIAANGHFVRMGEAIRRNDFKDLMDAATHAFSWMASFIAHCQQSKDTIYWIKEGFSLVVASKYPLICGHCLTNECKCNARSMDAQTDKAGKYEELLRKRETIRSSLNNDMTISKWQEEFGQIYKQNTHMLSLETIGFHFLEESGEQLAALRNLMQLEYLDGVDGIDNDFYEKISTFDGVFDIYKDLPKGEPDLTSKADDVIIERIVKAKVDVFAEFADTFSWFCSILNKVQAIASNCKSDSCQFSNGIFEERLKQEYFDNDGKPFCPKCKKSECECVFLMKAAALD